MRIFEDFIDNIDSEETVMQQSDNFAEVCVVGMPKAGGEKDGCEEIVAVFVPAKEFVQNYANENNIAFASYEELLEKPEIQALISSEIDRLVSAENGFRPCEKVFKFELLSESFQVGQELSAKQEMIRFKIAKSFSLKNDRQTQSLSRFAAWQILAGSPD